MVVFGEHIATGLEEAILQCDQKHGTQTYAYALDQCIYPRLPDLVVVKAVHGNRHRNKVHKEEYKVLPDHRKLGCAECPYRKDPYSCIRQERPISEEDQTIACGNNSDRKDYRFPQLAQTYLYAPHRQIHAVVLSVGLVRQEHEQNEEASTGSGPTADEERRELVKEEAVSVGGGIIQVRVQILYRVMHLQVRDHTEQHGEHHSAPEPELTQSGLGCLKAGYLALCLQSGKVGLIKQIDGKAHYEHKEAYEGYSVKRTFYRPCLIARRDGVRCIEGFGKEFDHALLNTDIPVRLRVNNVGVVDHMEAILSIDSFVVILVCRALCLTLGINAEVKERLRRRLMDIISGCCAVCSRVIRIAVVKLIVLCSNYTDISVAPEVKEACFIAVRIINASRHIGHGVARSVNRIGTYEQNRTYKLLVSLFIPLHGRFAALCAV